MLAKDIDFSNLEKLIKSVPDDYIILSIDLTDGYVLSFQKSYGDILYVERAKFQKQFAKEWAEYVKKLDEYFNIINICIILMIGKILDFS